MERQERGRRKTAEAGFAILASKFTVEIKKKTETFHSRKHRKMTECGGSRFLFHLTEQETRDSSDVSFMVHLESLSFSLYNSPCLHQKAFQKKFPFRMIQHKKKYIFFIFGGGTSAMSLVYNFFDGAWWMLCELCSAFKKLLSLLKNPRMAL